MENQTRKTEVQCFIDSQDRQLEIQGNDTDIAANDSGDYNISPHKITASQTEERLVRDETTNELYTPLSSTFVLKRKKEMQYVSLDFQKTLTNDALVVYGGYVSEMGQNDLDRIK